MAADQGVTTAPPASLTVSRRVALAFLLVPPMAWLVVAYLGSLAVLLVSAFWSKDSFTGAVVRTLTLDNVSRLFTEDVYRVVTLRTVGVAALVTVCCIVLAVPLALFMAKVASPRMRLALVVAVTCLALAITTHRFRANFSLAAAVLTLATAFLVVDDVPS